MFPALTCILDFVTANDIVEFVVLEERGGDVGAELASDSPLAG